MENSVTSELRSQHSNPEPSLQTRRVSQPTRPRLCGPTLQTGTSRPRALGREVGKLCSGAGAVGLGCCPDCPVWTPREEAGGPGCTPAGRAGSSPTCLHLRCLGGPAKWVLPNRGGCLGTARTPPLPASLLANRSDRRRLLNSSASTCTRGVFPGGCIRSERLPAAEARGPLGGSGPELQLRAEVAPGSARPAGGGAFLRRLEQEIASLPPAHVHKITALSMRRNGDLEALFVLSRGPRKRIAAFPGVSALCRSRKSSDGAGLTQPDCTVSEPGAWW